MTTLPTSNQSLRSWCRIVVGAIISIPIAIVLAPPLIVLSVHSAWCRARLRRAIGRAWPRTVRFVVRDTHGDWDALLRDEWMPHYASVTILLPPAAKDADASDEERLARRVLGEWGGFHKSWGIPDAIFVAPGELPQPIYVTLDRRLRAQSDSGRLRQRMDALLAFARSTSPAAALSTRTGHAEGCPASDSEDEPGE